MADLNYLSSIKRIEKNKNEIESFIKKNFNEIHEEFIKIKQVATIKQFNSIKNIFFESKIFYLIKMLIQSVLNSMKII